MPRHSRLDIAGHLYHVLSRGIEQRKIFLEEGDYKEFLFRLKNTLEKTGNKCLAWCLMPNHFHLLILRGKRPLSDLMRKLMTGYAVNFNIKYERAGHLFQNRYKAILCDEEQYFHRLIAYIHLNPLRAEIIKSLEELRKYKWCGHKALMGECPAVFLERDYVLRHFSSNEREAVKKYEGFISNNAGKFKRGEYSGGGVLKSLSGLINLPKSGEQEEKMLADERILGSEDFIKSILKEAGIKSEEKMSPEKAMASATDMAGVTEKEILSRTQERRVVRARELYCYLAKDRGMISGSQLKAQLRMTSGGISRLVERGRNLFEQGECVNK